MFSRDLKRHFLIILLGGSELRMSTPNQNFPVSVLTIAQILNPLQSRAQYNIAV